MNKSKDQISIFTQFFWWCSGANTDILLECPQSEHNKYVGIGATVFFTGLLASLSGGYALFTIFNNLYYALFFGLIWGSVIFNLDRFIVSTLRKEGNFGKEFKLVLPRIILAFILAIVISKPLELKIFEKEIARKLEEKQRDFAIETQRKSEQQYNPIMDSLRKEVNYYKSEILVKSNQRDSLYKQFITEAEGTSGTFKLGKGPVFKEKKQQYDKIETELKELENKYTPLIAQREQKTQQTLAERDTSNAKAAPSIANYDGLMARMEALDKLPKLPSFFILLLFICIETAPIFTKLISKKGPYDEILNNIEHQFELINLEEMNIRNHELNKKLTLFSNIDKAKIESEISNNQEAMKIVSDAHLELTKDLVEDWLQTEKQKIKNKQHS